MVAPVRRVAGAAVIAAALMYGLRLAPQALGFAAAQADVTGTSYSATNPALITCSQPSLIRIKKGRTGLPVSFRCVNRYNVPVSLNWSIDSVAGTGAALTVSGTGAVPADPALSDCYGAALSDSSSFAGGSQTYTVTWRGTHDAGGLYASVTWTAPVEVHAANNGTDGGGCP